MNILTVCTDKPGLGGASTSFFYVNKVLNNLGHTSRIFFTGSSTCKPQVDYVPDVLIGKNHYGFYALLKTAKYKAPKVFVTSSIKSMYDYASKKISFVKVKNKLKENFGIINRNISRTDLLVPNSLSVEQVYKRTFHNVKFSDSIFLGSLASVLAIDFNYVPWHKRDIYILMACSDWNRSVKNPFLAKKISDKLGDKVVCVGKFSKYISKNSIGIIPHKKFLRILANSKILVIPSFYDSSPALVFEAIKLGVNVLVSENVGHHGFLPQDCIVPDCELLPFMERINFLKNKQIVDPSSITKDLIYGEVEKFVKSLERVVK